VSSPAAAVNAPPASPEQTALPEQAGVETAAVESHGTAAARPETQVELVDAPKPEIHSQQLSAAAVSEQDTAHDDAVLDMIALEMGAPDFDEPETVNAAIGDPVIAEPEQAAGSIANSSDPSPGLGSETIAEIAAPPSLGASLLNSGIVPRATPRSDPLAPIQRMTQAEKIAFFS
jgi:hypothetical protein